MRIRLNPYGENLMYIDKEVGVFLSVSSPVCTIADELVTNRMKWSIKAGTLLVEELEVPPIPEPEPEVKVKKKAPVRKTK